MHRLTGSPRDYEWGSHSTIQEFLGTTTSGPIAELWFGAHPSAPSAVAAGAPDDGAGASADASAAGDLRRLIETDPGTLLGEDVRSRFGDTLPYLLKIIAAERPLSLQVHPNIEQARTAFTAEEERGVPLDAPHRNYRDRNHKPELVYALTRFEALCGFRAPRRAAELVATLDAPLAERLSAILRAQPSAEGIRAAFTALLSPATRPSAAEVQEVVRACAARLEAGSPSPRADRIVVRLAEAYPGDPGVVTSLLLNPVTLQPGEALFVPAGGVHAYLHGTAIELMASSDNVLRAGLTPKHVDVDELLATVDYVAAPPIRIAPERFHGASRVYYAPVDDFELSVTTLADDDDDPNHLPGRGPRILLCLDGEVTVSSAGDGTVTLQRGDAVFAPASDGPLTARGAGTVVQADVP